MKEKILLKLQELRESERDSLAAMEFAAERSLEMIRAYCSIKEVPEALLGVAVTMAGKMLDSGTAEASRQAKSIREGDVSVTFAEGTDSEAELLGCFRAELDRYRRMDW